MFSVLSLLSNLYFSRSSVFFFFSRLVTLPSDWKANFTKYYFLDVVYSNNEVLFVACWPIVRLSEKSCIRSNNLVGWFLRKIALIVVSEIIKLIERFGWVLFTKDCLVRFANRAVLMKCPGLISSHFYQSAFAEL